MSTRKQLPRSIQVYLNQKRIEFRQDNNGESPVTKKRKLNNIPPTYELLGITSIPPFENKEKSMVNDLNLVFTEIRPEGKSLVVNYDISKGDLGIGIINTSIGLSFDYKNTYDGENEFQFNEVQINDIEYRGKGYCTHIIKTAFETTLKIYRNEFNKQDDYLPPPCIV